MIAVHNRAPQKVADDLVAFVIMPRPIAAPRNVWLVVELPKQKATINLPTSTTFSQSATLLAILLTYQIIPRLPISYIVHSVQERLSENGIQSLRGRSAWWQICAIQTRSPRYTSISPLLSIPTDLYLGESAVGKVSSSLQSILPAFVPVLILSSQELSCSTIR